MDKTPTGHRLFGGLRSGLVSSNVCRRFSSIFCLSRTDRAGELPDLAIFPSGESRSVSKIPHLIYRLTEPNPKPLIAASCVSRGSIRYASPWHLSPSSRAVPLGTRPRERADQFKGDLLDPEGDARDRGREGFCLFCMDPAFLSEENDAQVDSKVVPIALDAYRAVGGLEAQILETANQRNSYSSSGGSRLGARGS